MTPHSNTEQANAARYIIDMLAQLAAMAEAEANEPEMAELIRALVTARSIYAQRFSGLVEGLEAKACAGDLRGGSPGPRQALG